MFSPYTLGAGACFMTVATIWLAGNPTRSVDSPALSSALLADVTFLKLLPILKIPLRLSV